MGGVTYHIDEVNKMTKTLYDPEFEKRVFEKAFKEAFEKGRQEVRGQAIEKLLLSGMEAEEVASILDIDICLIRKISERLK